MVERAKEACRFAHSPLISFANRRDREGVGLEGGGVGGDGGGLHGMADLIFSEPVYRGNLMRNSF